MCNARIRQCSNGSPRLTNSDFDNTENGSEHPCDVMNTGEMTRMVVLGLSLVLSTCRHLGTHA